MLQFASGVPGDRHHLKAVPMYGHAGKTVDITVCQRADGSDWLLGAGSSGKVRTPYYQNESIDPSYALLDSHYATQHTNQTRQIE